MTLALLLLAIPAAFAACPNGCSSHGECAKFDSCECHSNWLGGDCSQRQCPTHWSWVTTPQGDLNYDGDKNDATIYDTDHRFDATSVNVLVDQFNPGGTWESWPSFFNTGDKDEGHFYMECSNRGTCNRKEGQCECFPGYTGVACRRTTCPEDCSGHGRCVTVQDQAGSFAYNLWDKDMSRSCVCDPGFVGPACAERACPKGDDPLTVDDQRNEVQWIDVYTDDLNTAGTDGSFKGSITFTYTDYWGASWTTGTVDVRPAGHESDGVTAATMGAAAEAALEGLPNNVLRNVDVSVGYCDEVLPTDSTIGTTTFTGFTAGQYYRCPAIATASAMGGVLLDDEGGPFSAVAGWYKATGLQAYSAYPTFDIAGAKQTLIDTDDTCNHLTHAHCTRFKVTFSSTPGNLAQISADTSGMTVKNQDTTAEETTAQGATSVGTRSLDSLPITTATATLKYKLLADTKKECAASDACTITTTAGVSTITLTADGTLFNTNERIRVKCGTKVLGTYTVHASDHPTATEIITQERIPACDGNANNEVKVYLDTHFVWVNTDFTRSHTATTQLEYSRQLNTGDYFTFESPAVLSTCTETAGTPVTADTDACAAQQTIDQAAGAAASTTACGAIATDSTADDAAIMACTYTAYVAPVTKGPYGPILADPDSSVGAAIYWQTDNTAHAGDFDGRIFVANAPGTADLTTSAGVVHAHGQGSTEASECSDRGTCETESGLCKCFAGYTGHACETQNSLAA